MTSRRQKRILKRLRRVAVPASVPNELPTTASNGEPSMANHSLDSMKFDDGGEVDASPPSSAPASEPATKVWMAYKLVHDNPGRTSSQLRELATAAGYDRPFRAKLAALLLNLVYNGRIKRTDDPDPRYEALPYEAVAEKFRSTAPVVASPPAPPSGKWAKRLVTDYAPDAEPSTMSYRFYELMKEYPGRTSGEYRVLCRRNKIELLNLYSTLSRFTRLGLVRRESGTTGFTFYPQVEKFEHFPAKMLARRKQAKRRTGAGFKAKAKEVNIDAVHAQRPAPKPAPAPAPVPAPAPALAPTTRERGPAIGLPLMAPEDIVNGMSVAQAKRVWQLLGEFFK